MNHYERNQTKIEPTKNNLYPKSLALLAFQAILWFGCASTKNQTENSPPQSSLQSIDQSTSEKQQSLMLFPIDRNNLTEIAPTKQYKIELTQKMTNVVSNFLVDEKKTSRDSLDLLNVLPNYTQAFERFNSFLETTSPFFQGFFETNFVKGLEPKKGHVLTETDKKNTVTIKAGEMLFIGGDEIKIKGEAESFQINLKSQNKKAPKERTMHYVFLFNRGRRPYDVAVNNFFADSTYATIPNETDHSRAVCINVPWVFGRVLSADTQVKYLTLTICDISKGQYETISPIDLDALLQLHMQRQKIPPNPSRDQKK